MILSSNYKNRYISYRDNLLDDFYKPVISESTSYKRMSGYFSSKIIDDLYEEISESNINNEFKIQLICSPEISSNDLELINEGYSIKHLIETRIIDSLLSIEKTNNNLPYITKLIASGVLDIRFVVPKDGNGLFHAKEGIFSDAFGNKIAFIGSNNETGGALYRNFETTTLLFSDSNYEEIEDMENLFEKIWFNRFEGLLHCDITENIRKEVDRINNKYIIKEDKEEYGRKKITNVYSLYPYQLEAIKLWESNNYVGLLEMATGTGKTITALACQEKLLEVKENAITVIVAPQIDLVNQWAEEMSAFNINAIKCSSEQKNYIDNLKIRMSSESSSSNPTVVITTSQTFLLDKFQKVLRNYISKDALLICDEVHSFGSTRMRTKYKELEKLFPYRLGVSATPYRKNDEESTELIDFFDKIIFKYDLKDAIENGFLNQYVYYPIIMSFNKNELENYRQTLSHSLEGSKKVDAIKLKEIERITSRIANSNIKKVDKLKEILDGDKKKEQKIIYCSPGNYNDGEAIMDDRHINFVSRELGQHGCRLKRISSEVPSEQRTEILELFKSHDIDTLLAIKCLDQGVNLKEVTHAYILSSTDSLTEFIQRRGRILRKSPNKPISVIYDFIMLPQDPKGPLFDPQMEDGYLVDRELRRMVEFNYAAENVQDNKDTIENIKDSYYNVLEELSNGQTNRQGY